MRTIIGFAIALAVCVGVAGYLAVDAFRGAGGLEGEGTGNREQGTGASHPELEARSEPGARPEPEAQARATPAPDASTVDTTAPHPGSIGVPSVRDERAEHAPTPAPGTIRWADAGRPAAERRLALARTTLRHQPDHEAALRDEAAALAELGRWREAEASLRNLVALRPDDVELRFNWAAALLRQRRHREAADALMQVVANDPNHDRAWFNLAVAHQSLGRLQDALDAWNRAIALRPTATARLQRATLLLDLRDFAAAAADFEWLLAHEPISIDTSHNLATAYRRLGRYDDAQRILDTVLALKPRHVPTINRAAEIAWEASQQPGADAPGLVRATIERCTRSLDIDQTQADVLELKTAAEARLAKLVPPG